MKRTIAAAIFALLAVSTPAHAAFVPIEWYQIDSLNLTYPGNTTLTGDLDIQDGAPSVGAYIAGSNSSLSVNGNPLRFITGGTGYLYGTNGSITFYVPPPNAPDAATPYGEVPLYLSVPNIFLNGIPASGGTVSTEFCTSDGTNSSCTNVSAVPLPPRSHCSAARLPDWAASDG
jgi:hypothetical protein